MDWQLAQNTGSSGTDSGRSIAFENYGISYLTQCFKGTASFGNTTLTGNGYPLPNLEYADPVADYLKLYAVGGLNPMICSKLTSTKLQNTIFF